MPAQASHAAVFPFTAISVMGTLMSGAFLGERLTWRKGFGIAVVVTGLVILSGLDLGSHKCRALLGDVMFVAASMLWVGVGVGFGIAMRKHRIDPSLATAVVSFAALLTCLPAYLGLNGLTQLLATPSTVVWVELLVQELLAGVGTLYTSSRMVALLGPASAALFPALATGIAALPAWQVLQHVPSGAEAAGLVISVLGLPIAVSSGSQAAVR